MTAIIKKLLALAMAFTLALSLVGCGVNITGVSLNLPDTIEKGTALVATPEYAFDGATPETAELEKKLDKLEMHYTSSDPSILVVLPTTVGALFPLHHSQTTETPTHCSRSLHFCL